MEGNNMKKIKFTRRDFLKTSLMTGAVLATGGLGALIKPGKAHAFSYSQPLKKFVWPLPLPGAGIQVAQKDALSTATLDHYSISIKEFTQQLHPDLPNPTRLWGYYDTTAGGTQTHLGSIIIAKQNTPVQITFTNELLNAHPLPVDTSVPGAETGQLVNRVAVHLHGGKVPWISDGGPFDWWAPDGTTGPSFLNNQVLNPGAGLNQAEYYYPMNESARLLWYHDHAFGITRLNAYAGIASGCLVRDAFEQNLINTFSIPGFIPGTEIPLVIQDKTFFDGTDTAYTNYVTGALPGDLWYPYVYDPLRWMLMPGPSGPPPIPSCVPEAFGDTMLVNGVVYPYVEVEPRKYRFRVLDACNARFCNLKLYYAQGATFPNSAEPNLKNPGPNFLQIGNEGGFLSSKPGPALLPNVVMGPGERADLIVDFSKVPVGSYLILYNDAPSPFPAGDPLYDFYPGSKKNPVIPTPGFGPNTRTLLQFRVVPLGQVTGDTAKDPKQTAPLKLPQITPLATTLPPRDLTLNEDFDQFGRLMQTLGTNVRPDPAKPTFGRALLDLPTETITAGDTEIWRIFNLTADTHPMHFHLINVQVIGRQPFNAKHYNGTPSFTGAMLPPAPNETGWKETVRANPGECLMVIAKFDLPTVPFIVPPSPRTGGNEYVWHCHILEHEEHDMMRPVVVS